MQARFLTLSWRGEQRLYQAHARAEGRTEKRRRGACLRDRCSVKRTPAQARFNGTARARDARETVVRGRTSFERATAGSLLGAEVATRRPQMENTIVNGPWTRHDAPLWYAIQARPHQEQRVVANLASQGIETLLPKVRSQLRRVRPGMTADGEALFPGYLFARFDAPSTAVSVRYTRGVARILSTAEGPSRVEEEIIAAIRGRIGDDGYVRLGPSLAPGDHVRITGGPLRDFVGVFEASAHPSRRMQLLLSAVHAQIRVSIEHRFVEKVAAAR
jgi:transcriptional antiterminator RfaH